MDRKVSTAYLKIGMYVSKLDKPWREAPFNIQGFFIKDESEIFALVKNCNFVYIDIDLGVPAEMYLDTAPGAHTKQSLASNVQAEQILETGKKAVVYQNKHSTVEEMPQAMVALDNAAECVAQIVERDLQKGRLNITTVKAAVEPIIDSMIRNADAFMWLSKLRSHNADSYQHAVQNCALGIAFGRHLGLKKKELNTLATGLLLMDIGKIRLPQELLTKTTPLTQQEAEMMRKHVAFTVEILRKTKGINDHVVNIALTHHERYDGSGYPNGLVGVQTPTYGRIAAIIDCYDAMTCESSFKETLAEHKALQNIYNLRDKYFQKELVEQFMQCMGVYPTGSLVELSSGAVGAVLAQNAQQKMKPKILLLLDAKKHAIKKRKILDFNEKENMPLFISKSLENMAYGVDMQQVKF